MTPITETVGVQCLQDPYDLYYNFNHFGNAISLDRHIVKENVENKINIICLDRR